MLVSVCFVEADLSRAIQSAVRAMRDWRPPARARAEVSFAEAFPLAEEREQLLSASRTCRGVAFGALSRVRPEGNGVGSANSMAFRMTARKDRKSPVLAATFCEASRRAGSLMRGSSVNGSSDKEDRRCRAMRIMSSAL